MLSAALLWAPAAFAQDAAPAPIPATPAAAASVTDAEVTSFATAARTVSKLQADAAVPEADKQTKIVAAIQGSGITPARFNEIATLFQSDPAFQARVRAAAGPAPSATPGAAQPQQ
jgi:hypothetical protein